MDRGFAFLDLEGFTAFTEREGDESACEVLGTFRTVIRQLASDEGVRIAKWIGDGCMIVSTDTSHLVAAVAGIVGRLEELLPLKVRAGIAAGRVILFEGDDHIGTPVNLAAKLCDHAGPGEVLVGPGVAEHLPAGALEQVGVGLIPGFPVPVPAARLRLAPALALHHHHEA